MKSLPDAFRGQVCRASAHLNHCRKTGLLVSLFIGSLVGVGTFWKVTFLPFSTLVCKYHSQTFAKLLGFEGAPYRGFPLGFGLFRVCFFSPAIMVLANFRKTIAIDLSAMSSDLNCQDVNILLDFFPHVTVKSIQFVPVKLAHVTFEDSTTKDYYIRYDELEFNGVKCRVLGAGSRAQQVLVYHYPYAEDDESLKSVLEDFGKVLGIRHQHYAGQNAVLTGTLIVQMIRDRPIRRNLMVDGYRVKVWYVGQPLESDICSRGHISRDCPMRGKWRHCGEPGHLTHACKNPPRAWDVLTKNNDESSSSSASADPTPAEAVQISSGTGSSEEPSLSCSMFSGVGAGLVSGGCDWGDSPAPEEGDTFSLSASDSDSSLDSHVSPSLSKRSSTSVNNDQSKRNGNSKNDSDKRENDMIKLVVRMFLINVVVRMILTNVVIVVIVRRILINVVVTMIPFNVLVTVVLIMVVV